MRRIHLSASEIMLVAHRCEVLNAVKRMQAHHGLVKSKLHDKDQDDFDAHYAGMLGEMAVCKLLSVPLRTDVTVGGDDDTDIVYRGINIQVRTVSVPNRPTYLKYDKLEDFKSPLAILCRVHKPNIIDILGFISKHKFAKEHEMKPFGYGDRFVVGENNVTSMDKIDTAVDLFLGVGNEKLPS